MANVVRCANGHFYDAEKTSECPYCQKKDQDRIELQNMVKNIPQFQYQAGSINEDVTLAMPAGQGEKEASVMLNGEERRHVMGISAPDDQVTVAVFKKHLGTGYVTGWLVCVKGPVKGRDYRIMHGMNWIGTSQNMDIWIDGGSGISQNRHCAIVYDGKSNQFFIAQGAGSLTYVNGELLEKSRKLELGDSIQLGQCTFEFIPFCREGHVWTVEEKSDSQE